jgi:hypothetical protein
LRRLVALHGLSWVVGIVIPLVILAGLADWLLHLDSLIRAAILSALVATALYWGYRRVLRPLFVRFADLDIAMRIEERWPGLNDRLASTIQFMKMDARDDRQGSPAMREATVRDTIEQASKIDFRQVIEPRPVIRAVAGAAGSIALAAALFSAAPGSARIAMARLFDPFGGPAWPRQTHLVLDERQTTLKVARGDSFTLAVKVRPGDKVPELARATYRFADGEVSAEPLRLVDGGEFRGRMESVTQPFEFSVAAGDDSSSIRDIAVRVVPPPAVDALAIKLIAPEYTGLPAQLLAPGLTQVRTLEGTRLELLGRSNRPLANADLRRSDQPAAVALGVDQTQVGFRTTLAVKGNFSFWFELKDIEGFQSREAVKYDVRGIRDEAPRVVIDEPKSDRDVPADATVPVRVLVDDDFGLHSSRLIYRLATGDSEPHAEVAIPLWSADREKKPDGTPLFAKHAEISHKWELAPLKLAVGTLITLYADARDFDTLSGPNVGRSREIRLRIISKEDASRQFDDGRRELREEIARVLTMEKQAMTPVENAMRTLSQTDRLPPKDRDDLANAGMIQRQVNSRLNNRDDGVGARLTRMLDDERNLKLDNAEARNQLEDMLKQLEAIRAKNLGPAEQALTRASKSLDQNAAENAPGREPRAEPEGAEPAPESAASKSDSAPSKSSSQASKSAAQKSAASKSGSAAQSKGQDGDSADAKSAPASGEPEPAAGQDAAKAKASPSSSKPSSPSGAKPATKGSETPKPGNDSTQLALNESKTNQKAIADQLQKMLDNLSEFETYRGVVKDAQELLKQHEQTMKQTDEAAAKPDIVGKGLDDLNQEQKADLGNLASRQGQVGKNLQNLLERMGEMAGRTSESDPMASAAMREAAEKTKQRGTTGKLGEAADQLGKNQMGEARTRQEQARDDLRELVDSIQNRRERELSRLVKELKNAEAEMAKTRQAQAQNLKKTREAQRNPDAKQRAEELKRLAKQQAEIQNDLKRQLQKLAKLNAERAAQAGQTASGKMGQAEGNLDEDQGDDAAKREEEALADLDDAQEELEETRREAEEQLAMEQLSRMGDRLKALAERQGKVVTETGSYEAARKKNDGKMTSAHRAGVKGLGQVQTGIREETAELIENLEGAPVFALTLRRAAASMDEAAKRLGELKTDSDTERAAKAAADRFKQLTDSLKPDAAGGGGGQGGGGGGGGGGGQGGGGDGIPATAQLKMLKSLQQEINERTEAFDELQRRHKTLTPEQSSELKKIGEDQGVLADLVRDMTRPKRDDGEE